MDLGATLNSGQVFLWEDADAGWFGIDGQNIIRALPDARAESRFPAGSFFREDDDAQSIISEISQDRRIARAVKECPGLRLLRQDPFQCCISFIASSNSSIPRIRSCLRAICRRYGSKIRWRGRDFCVFPAPEKLARAGIGGLLKCGLGYRAIYVKKAACDVAAGRINLEGLKKADYYDAREELTGMAGVGHKVADCIMLFSLDKLEAFPLDRWMCRALERHYPGVFEGTASLTPARYERVHERLVEHFGRYAGYAQQFLFRYEREKGGMGW